VARRTRLTIGTGRAEQRLADLDPVDRGIDERFGGVAILDWFGPLVGIVQRIGVLSVFRNATMSRISRSSKKLCLPQGGITDSGL